jgi:hypothetical protein
MPLDARGVWIDQIKDGDCGIGADKPSGHAVPAAGSEPRLPPMPPADLPPPAPEAR